MVFLVVLVVSVSGFCATSTRRSTPVQVTCFGTEASFNVSFNVFFFSSSLKALLRVDNFFASIFFIRTAFLAPLPADLHQSRTACSSSCAFCRFLNESSTVGPLRRFFPPGSIRKLNLEIWGQTRNGFKLEGLALGFFIEFYIEL